MKMVSVQPFGGPSFDLPPDLVATRRRTYVVCSAPRSGSGLLCRALGATGVAGTPTEYFSPPVRPDLSERWECGPGLAAYAETLLARRTGPTGVFGTKLHWSHLEALHAESLGRRPAKAPFDQPATLLEDLLGGRPTYVHILRLNVDRQAISLWTAEHNGVFARRESDAPSTARVPYSFAGIQACRRRVALSDLHWDRFFRFNGIEPIEVVYEDLCASYGSTVARVVDRLVPGAAPEIAPPMTVRLADERSEELLERFLADLSRRHPQPLRERIAQRVRPLRRG